MSIKQEAFPEIHSSRSCGNYQRRTSVPALWSTYLWMVAWQVRCLVYFDPLQRWIWASWETSCRWRAGNCKQARNHYPQKVSNGACICTYSATFGKWIGQGCRSPADSTLRDPTRYMTIKLATFSFSQAELHIQTDHLSLKYSDRTKTDIAHSVPYVTRLLYCQLLSW